MMRASCRRVGLGLGASGLGLACRRSGLGLGASGLGLACRRLLTLTQALASCIAQSMVSAQRGLCSTVGYLARVRVRARATEPNPNPNPNPNPERVVLDGRVPEGGGDRPLLEGAHVVPPALGLGLGLGLGSRGMKALPNPSPSPSPNSSPNPGGTHQKLGMKAHSISPYISPYLPIAPHISPYQKLGMKAHSISPHISPYLPMSPHISPYQKLGMKAHSPARTVRESHCTAPKRGKVDLGVRVGVGVGVRLGVG